MSVSTFHIYSDDGTVIITDTRIFFKCKEFALQQLRKQAMEKILEFAPEYKQRNAALGLLSPEETDTIKNHIQTIRTASNIKEAEIAAVEWNGSEETRASACDAVLAITL